MNPNSSDPFGRPPHDATSRDPRAGLRTSDPSHPLAGSSPSHPLAGSSPSHSALRGSSPSHPLAGSSSPSHSALRGSSPSHPLAGSSPSHSALSSSSPSHRVPPPAGGHRGPAPPSDQGQVRRPTGRGPRRIGRYTVVEELGRGNYGVVYKATREGLERHFAVKVLTTSALQNEEAQARFEREAKVASKIDHPGIVPVFDVGKEAGLPYFVMEFVPGRPLSSRLKEEGRLPPAEAARLVAALADAMTAAHEKGVIHRDLKPANVMLQAPNDTPRIMDFGLARDSNASMSLTKTGDAIGTPYYMAPEQIRGRKDVDARADVYALGVNLYECLTGRVPFPGSTFMEIAQRIRQGWVAPPTQIVPEIPKRLEEICLQAMALERDDRYSSARDLHEDLVAFLRSSGELAAVDPPGDRKSIVIATAITAILALTTLLVLGFVLRKQARENEARALIARAGGLEKRAEAEPLLDRAEALASGDQDLLERIRVAREGHLASAALVKLRALIQDGAVGEIKVHLDAHAHLEPVKTEATRVANQLLEQSRSSAAGAALEERALSQLAKARELALDAALVERVDHAEQRVRARGYLRRAKASARRDPRAARELLNRAKGLAVKDPVLRAEIARASSDLDVRTRLALVWRACDRGARLPELLALIQQATASAGESPELQAEIRLARVAAHYYRGGYAKAAELATELGRRPDRSGYVARYIRGMSEFRLERANSTATLQGVMNDDPNGVGGLLAAAFVNTVMVPNGAPQGETCARRVLKLEPNNADAQISLAFSLHNQSRYAAAWREAQRAMELAPGHPRAFLAKGFVKQAGGDLEAARAGYTRVIQLTEPRPMRRALLRRAQVSRALREPESAITDLSRLLADRPDDLTTLLLRAGVREEAGQDEAALADWKRAAELSPDQTRRAVEMHRGRLRPKIFQLLGEPAPAQTTGGTGPQAPVFDVKTPLGRAQRLAQRGEPLARVVAAFKTALAGAEGAEAEVIRIEFVDVLYRRGQGQAALEAVRPLVGRKDVIGQRAQYLQGFCRMWTGYHNTLPTFRGAFDLDPNSLWGLNAGSAFHVLSNRNTTGVRLAEAAIAKFPNDVEAYITITFALCQQPARHALAERLIKRALIAAPHHARGHLAHAYILSARRKHAQALKALDRAVATSQPNPIRHALTMRAKLALSSRPKQALADADLLLKRSPRDLQSLLIKALALEFLKRRPEADAAWKAGFAANPRTFRVLVQRSLGNNRAMLERVLKLATE